MYKRQTNLDSRPEASTTRSASNTSPPFMATPAHTKLWSVLSRAEPESQACPTRLTSGYPELLGG